MGWEVLQKCIDIKLQFAQSFLPLSLITGLPVAEAPFVERNAALQHVVLVGMNPEVMTAVPYRGVLCPGQGAPKWLCSTSPLWQSPGH